MNSRIYVVTNSSNEQRLIRAVSASAALRHVALDQFDVEVAKQAILADLLLAGVPLEDSTKSGSVE